MDKEEKKKDYLQGFTVLKLRYSATTPAHDLFVKEHSVRTQSSDKPAGRTLFVLNVPHYVTENCLKELFKAAGKVSSVIIQAKPSSKNVDEVLEDTQETQSGFKVAYVIFSQPVAISKALKLNSLPTLDSINEEIVTGMNKWVEEYNNTILDPAALKKKADIFMKNYDKKEELLKQKDKQTVDEDGWITVTRNSRKPGFARKESVNNKIMEKIKTGKKQKELKNFYTFQIRESKQNRIAELRKKYEEDKMKISKMKQARKFKPY